MGEAVLRLRYVLAVYGKWFSIAFVVAALLGGVLTVNAMTAPPEERHVTVEENQQTIQTKLTGRALVTNESVLYDQGQTLRNQRVYFTGITPNLTITMTTNASASATVRQKLVIDVVGTVAEDQFYRQRHVIADRTSRTTNGSVSTSATISIPKIEEEWLGPIRKETAGVGVLSLNVRGISEYELGPYDETMTVSGPLEIDSKSYTFQTPFTKDRSHATTTTRTETVPASPTPGAGVFGVGTVLFLLGAVGVYRFHQERLPPRVLARHLERARHDDWISRGTIPVGEASRRVGVDSLSDLVDTGIDTERRVIHDEAMNAYAVFDGETIYHWSPEPPADDPDEADSSR